MSKAPKKVQKKVKLGRPKVGRHGITVKMMPEVISNLDKFLAALNKKNGTEVSRSEWIEDLVIGRIGK